VAPSRDKAEFDGLPHVLITVRSLNHASTDVIQLVQKHGLAAVAGDPSHDLKALRPLFTDVVAWIAGGAPITAAHVAAADRLRIIARYGVGVDAIDQTAVAAAGITLTNTPGANTESVADLTVALLLAATRHVVAGDRAVHEGRWPVLLGRELSTLAIGIIGFGQIGRAVGRRLRHFGCRIIACDPFVDDIVIAAQGCTPVNLDTLLQTADAITLHAPPSGSPLIDRRALSLMRPGAVLVNTGRGALLDGILVAEALRGARLGAVAVDVLQEEDPPQSPLVGAPNCIVTPHLGAQTLEANSRMGQEAVAEVVRFLQGLPVRHAVVPSPHDRRP
jgi:D-3-phosphoglycerate dehydrogenase